MRSIIKGNRKVLIFIVLLLVGGGYWWYQHLKTAPGETRYVLGLVENGTLITAVSGSGQVSVSNQFELKPKISGDVVYIGVASGQEVKAGTLLLQVDSRDAQKFVRDAQTNLDSARLSLEKLKKPADVLATLQAENALAKARESKQQSQDDLQKAYEDGFNLVANAFLDLPAIMTGLHDAMFTSTIASNQDNIDYYADTAGRYDSRIFKYRDAAKQSYNLARMAYDRNFDDYKAANRNAERSVLRALTSETYTTTKALADAVKDSNNLVQLYVDTLAQRILTIVAAANTHLATLNSYTGKTNAHLLNLLNNLHTIDTNLQGIAEADRTIADKTESLTKLKAGAEVLDIRSQELAVRQKQNALTDAQEKLADYFIRAPFDGVVAKMDLKKGDAISSGAAAVTLITKQQTAEISLNEVDVAKVKVGGKTTLTFDAVPDLSISGQVAQIDTLGTIAQGVVSYTIKISLDTQDARVKPGMSVNATIVTEVKQDILVVPLSALKSRGNGQYVEQLDQTIIAPPIQGVISQTAPRQVTVTTGLSNDIATEIVSGLKEGDQIIIRMIVPTAAATTTTPPSIFGGARIGGGGGAGAARLGR